MRSKKACILASVCSMIDQFNMPNIALLQSMGYEVHVVTNFQNGSTTTQERVDQVRDTLESQGVHTIHMPIPRSIFDVRSILQSYQQMKKLCKEHAYDLIHCHSPIGGVIARLGAAKSRKAQGTRVIYTAHGFHFYQGAPIQNWAVFYPIEKLCARLTDVLITINQEDYAFAQKHMNAGRVEYIPGVGVDTEKFYMEGFDDGAKKQELEIAEDDLLVLSVGELNQNKNHEVVIRAIAKLKNPKIHYFIAGKGDKEQYLTALAKELGVNLHLLWYRTDVIELLNAADIFVFPSFREGLSVALMEAMAAGLPCVVSEIRGNVDLVDREGGFLCKPDDADAFADALRELLDTQKRHDMGEHNRIVMRGFDVHRIMEMVSEVYGVEAGESAKP